MKIREIVNPVMYHGGRGLEASYRDMMGNKAKQMEYGPGLYLTNNFETASKYAKGGGKVYRVEFRPGVDIADVTLSMDVVRGFLKTIRVANRKALMADLERYPDTIPAYMFLNLLVNNEVMTASNSKAFREFFVHQGIDYACHKGFGMNSREIICVIFNPKIIASVTPTKRVSADDYLLPVGITAH